MPTSVETLLRLLDVERLDGDLFRGAQPPGKAQRMFGGQVLGQALAAAYRTVPDGRRVHSVHAYFILPGDTSQTVLFDVERLRDGRSFSTRRTAAIQGGRPIFYMTSSFQVAEEGLEHQDAPPATALAADALSCPRLSDYVRAHDPTRKPDHVERFFGVEVRVAAPDVDDRPLDGGSVAQVWMRVPEPLPDDQALHDCATAYMSDLALLPATMVPHNLPFRSDVIMSASLDHAMWFHRPLRADDWLLYDEASPSASGARGLALGRMFDTHGSLVVTTMQEGLVRPIGGSRAPLT